jgi:porin
MKRSSGISALAGTTLKGRLIALAACAVVAGMTPPAMAADSPAAAPPAAKVADAAAEAPKATGTVVPVQNKMSAMPTPDYTGEFLTRSTLSGDWGGTRQQLANKGFTVDGYLTQVGMGVVSGGLNNGWEYLGRAEIDVNLDTAKLGLWPGGLFTVIGEGHFGRPISPHAGVISPLDMNESLPEIDDSFVLPQVSYTQFLSEKFGFFVGKLTVITQNSGDMNEFAHGKGDRQFLNTSFSANPVVMLVGPYSTTGAGILAVPMKDLVISAAVIDPHGRADSAQFDDMFSNGVTFTLEGHYKTHFFDKLGHQLLGGMYSTSSYTDLDQHLGNLILPGLPTEKASDSWCVYYNFDQFFYQPDPKVNKGIGLFGRLGVSDGVANPVHWFASGGVGGKGMISGRPNDGFGIGYFYMGIADTRITSPLGFGDSQGVEAFYDIALTPWLHLTPDIQWVQPSQERIDDAWIVGVRMFMAF